MKPFLGVLGRDGQRLCRTGPGREGSGGTVDHGLKTCLDSLQAQLSSIELRMATKTDLEALEHRMDTNLETLEQRLSTSLDALGRRMATDLTAAVDRLEESIKSRKEHENALYRIAEDHEQRIKRLEQKTL